MMKRSTANPSGERSMGSNAMVTARGIPRSTGTGMRGRVSSQRVFNLIGLAYDKSKLF